MTPSIGSQAMSKKELLDQPMLPPPPGVKSNFERPVTRIPSYNAIIIIPLILASLFVVLRIYTRAWISKSLGWDDYTSVISLVLDVPFCIGLTLAPLYGAGYHAWDVQLKKYTPLVKLQVVSFLQAASLILAVRFSILLLYLRVFSAAKRLAWFIYLAAALTTIHSLVVTFLTLFQCIPLKDVWNPFKTTRCLNIGKLGFGTVIGNIILDIFIFSLPLYHVCKLRMSCRLKIELLLLFGLASIACIVSAVRVKYFAILLYNPDYTWYLLDTCYWCGLEMNVAIICGCLPTLRPFVRKYIPKFTIHTLYGRNKSNGSKELFNSAQPRKSELFGAGSSNFRPQSFVVHFKDLTSSLPSSKSSPQVTMSYDNDQTWFPSSNPPPAL